MALLHVAYDMTFPSRNPAGSGVYANELLAALQRRDEVEMSVVGAPRTGLPNTLLWLGGGARAAAEGVQVLHCPAFVAPWRAGVPLVVTIHDTSTQRFPEDHPLEWRTYANVILPRRARAAACVITGTEYTKGEIVRDLGVREDRVVVTPYGVSERFAGPRRNPRAPGAPPLLLFPGAPTRRKNLEVVLSALANAPEASALRRAHLAITGAGANQFPRHRVHIESLGLADRVEWRGRVPAEQMPDLVANADVLVYPSLYEGFGFPALEAMLARTPVVASNATCLPEVLGDGALLVDPHDVSAFAAAVEAVLTQDEVRRGMIDRGRTQAKRYSWPKCASQTIETYQRVARA